MNSEAINLQEAVERYVRYIGGTMAVVGGIQIRRPDPKVHAKYELVVGFVGTVPDEDS